MISTAETRFCKEVTMPPNNLAYTAAAKSVTKAFIAAWSLALIFYFIVYAVRSSPAVMIPELASSFNTTPVGVSTVLGGVVNLLVATRCVKVAAWIHRPPR